MKYFVFFFAILFLGYLPAQDSNRFISVVGTAEVSIQADQIIFSIAIKTIDESLEDSKIENEKTIAQLLNTLKEFSKEQNDVEMLPFSFGINIKYENGKNIEDGFYTSTQIKFKLREIEKYFDLLDKLIKIENVSINNSQYNSSEYEKFNKHVYENAIIAAKEKAQYLASKADVKIVKVLEIEDNIKPKYQLQQSYPNPFNVSTSVSSRTNQVFGGIKINRSVRVKYKIEDLSIVK